MPPLIGSPKGSLSFKQLPAEDSRDNPTFPTPPLSPPSAQRNLFIGLAVGGGVIFVGIIVFAALMYWFRRKEPAPTEPAPAEEDGRRSEEDDTGEEYVVREIQVQSVEDSSSSS
ncbi:hypothetical protein MRB53_005070 [Persea americana]|uniref:Uncharacterized protein n=1 Tax=Persea americana TaxID=3435 RepID=A0ACC2MDS5_PERAE|nr:hypothetical protein MRB53_005070 [Persea americana]